MAVPTPLPSGHAKASVIQGLPVPAQAQLVHTRPGQTAEYGLAAVTISSANSWYDRQLPSGLPWHDWQWVSPTGPGCLNLFHSKGIDRTWIKGDSMLTLTTTNGTSGSAIVIEVLPKPNKGFPVC
jgi:hypothetical protein